MKGLHDSHDSHKIKSKQIVVNQEDIEKLEIKIEKTHKLFFAQQFHTNKSVDGKNPIYSLDLFKKRMFSRHFEQMNENKLERHKSKYTLK